MNWLLLRAKLCLSPCFRQVLPPSQGGLTPPSPGPHTAEGKCSCPVFWNLLEGLVQGAGLQQQLEMTQHKKKGQASGRGEMAGWLIEITDI